MKTVLVSSFLVLVFGMSNLEARDHFRHFHHHSHHAHWIVPLVVGGVIGYSVSRSEPERVVTYAPTRYREEWVYFEECDCKRRVLVEER